MKLEIEVEGAGGAVAISDSDIERVEQLIERIDALGIDGASILGLALGSEASLNPARPIRELQLKHTALKVHRVCVELHFESDHQRHYFPVTARWARVHRWGCRQFTIAHDACANLELRLGAQDGPAVNERKPIGTSEACQVVWLVKPGPEPNGDDSQH